MNLNIALCEGVHDVAFLTRVLLSDGYRKSFSKINDFENPLDKLFITKYRNHQLDDETLDYSPNFLLPRKALIKDDNLTLIHHCGGDSNINTSMEIINQYCQLKGDDDFSSSFDFSIRFIFIFDADDYGVNERLNKISKDFKLPLLTQGKLIEHDGYEFGAFILSNASDKGRLEDVLLSIIETNEKTAFAEGEKFLNNCAMESIRTKEFIIKPCGTEDYKGGSKFDHQKALLSLVGQLQFSGATNTVFIEKSDVFKSANITGIIQLNVLTNLF